MHVFPQRFDDKPGPSSDQGLSDPNVQAALLDDFPESIQPHFLRILQHFSTDTLPTMMSLEPAQVAWQKAIPPLATSYKFVTHGILAIASLHLSTSAKTQQERQTYDDTAATQMNAGLMQYRVEVQNVTTKNADALFAFSTTITTFVLHSTGNECKAILRSITERTSSTERMDSISALSNAVFRIFRSIRGVLVIIVPCWHHIRKGPFGPVVSREWWPAGIPITAEQHDEDRKLQDLNRMWSRPGRTYDYSCDTLRHALKDLREAFALVSRVMFLAQSGNTAGASTFDWTSVFHWPVQLSLEFISLLEQRCMEAWVLIAHFAILPARATGAFWLDGLATSLVATAALVIGEENWNWISWPAAVVDVDLEPLRNPAVTSSETDTLNRETTTERPPVSLSTKSSLP
ncbi:Nn.00g006430.m01.CDS01 [Neocucurbitaria sp. VM-36]